MNKKKILKLDGFIKTLKLISVGVGAFAIAGIAICHLIGNKPVDKVEETTSVLPPANYTIIMGKQDNEVFIKFYKQASELHLKNISNQEYNCFLNGGGLNCVLVTAYQPKSDTTISSTKHKN